MKILDLFHELLYDTDRLTITIDKKDRMELSSKIEAISPINHDAEYDIEIKKHRQHRSLNANAYMWVLAEKIADVTHSTREEVYRKAIREVGKFTDVAVSNKATGDLVKGWSNKGIGWFTDTFDSRLANCNRVRLYYGSSSYNTKEMSRLIDDLVDEAKTLNIETETPEEIARLKATWEAVA